MKRLIFLLLFALLPCAAAAQEALYSISEVAAMTPEYPEYYEAYDKSPCLETQNMSFIDGLRDCQARDKERIRCLKESVLLDS